MAVIAPGPEQQQVALHRLGVEATVRALKAFPNSPLAVTTGLATDATVELPMRRAGGEMMVEEGSMIGD